MASTALGYSAIVMEQGPIPGLYPLLTPTPVSSLPVSLTNTIASSSTPFGMHLLIRAYNHTATGTITATGTAPLTLAAVTETTTTLPLLDSPGWYADYTTKAIFGAVNSSGVTLGGGLTNGTIAIYGVQAAHRLIVGEFKLNDKRSDHMPVIQSGTFDEASQPVLPMVEDPEWEYSGDFYPDDLEWLIEAGLNASPTVTAVPVGGTSLLGSTSVATSGTASLSTQPTAPGMILAITLGGTAPTASQAITVTGTLAGTLETITETIITTKTQGTFYSNNVYASVAASGVAFGAFGAGATITITGYFLWQLSAQPSNAANLGVFAAYQYDGIGNYVAPLCLVDSWELAFNETSEIKIGAKGPTQAILLVGDTTSASQQGPTFSLPQDQAIMGWNTLYFLDQLSGTPGTTQLLRVMEGKIAYNNKYKTTHTSAWNPPARWYAVKDRGRREIRLELKFYMDATTYDTVYASGFKKGKRYIFQMQIIGTPPATSGGTTYYPGWTVTVPFRFAEDPKREFTLSQEYVTVTMTGVVYKAPSLSYALQLVSNTHIQSWNQ